MSTNPDAWAERWTLLRSRAPAALIVALIGGGAFLAMGRVEPWLLGSATPLAGCLLGAFASSLIWYDVKRLTGMHIVVSAVLIFLATFAAIGLGLALEDFPQDPAVLVSSKGGIVGLLVFGAILTGWWVLPALVLVLWALRRGRAWKFGTSILAVIGFGWIALWIWPQLTSHKSYVLTIRNGGALAVLGGVLEDGDERRTIGPVPAGRETTFTLPRKGNARSKILLRRTDQSAVVCEVPWLSDEWGIDGTERDRIVVSDDTCRWVRTDDQISKAADDATASGRR